MSDQAQGAPQRRQMPAAVAAMSRQMFNHEAPELPEWWPIRMVKYCWQRPTALSLFVVRCGVNDEPYLVHLSLN